MLIIKLEETNKGVGEGLEQH